MPEPLLEREPVAVGVAGLTALIDAAIVLAAAFDWAGLTTSQATALVAFVTVASGVVGGFIRSRAWSPASVAALKAGG